MHETSKTGYKIHLPSFGPTLFLDSGRFYIVGLHQTAVRVGHLIPLQSPNPFQRAFQQ